MTTYFNTYYQEAIHVFASIQYDEVLNKQIFETIGIISEVLVKGKAVYFCGNGGSAADAQHLAAELSGKFKMERKALRAEALHVNSSFLTAVSNDFHFDLVYERAIEAFGSEGDVLIALSTSGQSKNVLNAVKKANEMGLCTIFIGGEEGEISKHSQFSIVLPSKNTPRLQEATLFVGHIICEEVEKRLFA
jgi:D-sedoheptulose 7-phosphate isomerase